MGRTYTTNLKLSNPDSGECNWDVDWHRNQTIKDVVEKQMMMRNFIFTGGALSYGGSGTLIAYSLGRAQVADVSYDFGAGTLTMAFAAAGETVMNFIYINSSGVASISISQPIGDYTLLGIADSDESGEMVRVSDLRAYEIGTTEPFVENMALNGTFDLWEYAITQTSSGYGSDNRFKNLNTGSTKVHSMQDFTPGQTDVPGNPKHFSRTVVTSVAGSANRVFKKTRLLDISRFAGKQIAVIFYAKADSSKDISLSYSKVYGDGGTAGDYAVEIETIALTATWAKYKAFFDVPNNAGKTLGDLSYFTLDIYFDAGSDFDSVTNTLGQQSGTFDIAEYQVYETANKRELSVLRPALLEIKRECHKYRVSLSTLRSRFYSAATSAYEWYFTFAYNEMIQAPDVLIEATQVGLTGNPTLVEALPYHLTLSAEKTSTPGIGEFNTDVTLDAEL